VPSTAASVHQAFDALERQQQAERDTNFEQVLIAIRCLRDLRKRELPINLPRAYDSGVTAFTRARGMSARQIPVQIRN
jgi:hypothetical protein